MSRLRLCALSVDLDEIRCYHAIHGLGAASGAAANAVYDRALPRFAELAATAGVPLTLFVVGRDLDRASNAARLRQLADGGHELGNHTHDHHYDFSRRPPDQIERQVTEANDAVLVHTGRRPTGFRAPGYVMTDAAYAALARAGMAYSSSLFPCPSYYAAKLSAMAALRARGKRSSSIVGHPGVLSAPRTPYRVGVPHYRPGAGLLELPIQVTPRLRLPFIGTLLSLLGPRRARRMTAGLVGQELINLELHGIDLLDADDGLAELAPHQPDVRVPLERKWAVLGEVIGELREHGYSFVRLDEAARRFAERLG